MKSLILISMIYFYGLEQNAVGFLINRLPSSTQQSYYYFNKTVECDPNDPRYNDPTCSGKCQVVTGPPSCIQLWRRRINANTQQGVSVLPFGLAALNAFSGGSYGLTTNTNTANGIYGSNNYNGLNYNNEEIAPPELQLQPTRRPGGRICGCPPQCLAYACPAATTCSSWVIGGVNANTACTPNNETFTAALSYDRIDNAWGCDECRCGHSNTPGGLRCPLSG